MAGTNNTLDPRLIAFVVIAVTGIFIVTAAAAVIRNRDVPVEWFALMGSIVGGVLSYGVWTRGGKK